MIVIQMFVICSLLVLKKHLDNDHKPRVEKTEVKLPGFKFYNLDSSTFSNNDIKKDKNVYLLYFDPDCDYCENEVSLILQNITKFSNTEILMISSGNLNSLKAMYSKFQISKLGSVHILWDKEGQFQNLFGKSIIPSSLIYGPNHILLKQYQGLVQISAITKWL